MNVDWSKAPEGATHFGAADNNKPLRACWYRLDEEGRFFIPSDLPWSEHNVWQPSQRRRDDLVARPVAAWKGSGLPPVGTVCEFAGGTPCPEDPFDNDLKEGMKVTIIAHFKCGDFTLAAFTFDPENTDRGMVQVEQGNFGCFRPIRTPEQIAAEEREAALAEILETINAAGAGGSGKATARALYDAGYRKIEIVEGE